MVKKIFKIIGRIFLILLLLLILAVGVIFVVDKVKDSQAWDKLIQGGYVNTVSVNGHKMNVCIHGLFRMMTGFPCESCFIIGHWGLINSGVRFCL